LGLCKNRFAKYSIGDVGIYYLFASPNYPFV
jgi:hypothetical protein